MLGLIQDPIAWLQSLLYMLPGLVIGFTVHEFCHAVAAVALGDPTPRYEGRLTLNPSAHIDWPGLALFVLLGWGYARPVHICVGKSAGTQMGRGCGFLCGPRVKPRVGGAVLCAVCAFAFGIMEQLFALRMQHQPDPVLP